MSKTKKDLKSKDEDIEIEDVIDEKEVESELQIKYDKVENSYQRLLADFENYKRRTANEILSSSLQGKVDVFKEIIDVIDNFERALQFEVDTKEFKDGIDMIYKILGEKLTKLGLKEIDTDDKMDPNKHQAIAVDNIEDKENDVITEVFQKGYEVEDKIIRPAMVKVNQKKGE